VLTRYLTRW